MSIRPLLLIALGLLLTSCQQQQPIDRGTISFTRYQPIHLAVSSIEFVEEYKSPMTPPYVEHLIPYSPADAMRIWIKDRLKAGGGEKSMRVVIKDGGVKMTPLDEPDDVTAFFSGQRKRYDASLDVEIRIYGDSPIAEANIEVVANRSITIPGDATLNQRSTMLRKIVVDLMEIANAELEKNMYQYMSNYIIYWQNP